MRVYNRSVLEGNRKNIPRAGRGMVEKGVNMLWLQIISILINLSIAIVAWLTWWDKHKK